MTIARRMLTLAALALTAGTWATAQPPELNKSLTEYRVHPIRYLDPKLVEDLVQQKCDPQRLCRIHKVERTHLAIIAPIDQQKMIAAYLADIDVPPKVYDFQVTLVRGFSTPQPASTVEFPPNLAKALDELREFLPYRSYEVADIGWIRTFGLGETALTPGEGRAYIARLGLRPPADATQPMMVDRFELLTSVDLGSGTSAVQPVVSGSFPIKVGETVVVGASKFLGSGKAMIVLLTAVGPKS